MKHIFIEKNKNLSDLRNLIRSFDSVFVDGNFGTTIFSACFTQLLMDFRPV